MIFLHKLIYPISGESVDKTCTRVIIVTVLLVLALFTTIYTVHSNNGNVMTQVELPIMVSQILCKISEWTFYIVRIKHHEFQFPFKLLPKAAQDVVENACNRLGVYGHGGRQYAVVIDAGSTGTRVLGFSFHRSILDNSLRLDDELWQQVKPGLSWYHEQPENCSQGIMHGS